MNFSTFLIPDQLKTLFDSAEKFQNTVPRLQQKRLSAFYTQPPAALLLAELAINAPDDMVLDPACGSGILLLAALAQKNALLRKEPALNAKKIRANQLVGCEIDSLAFQFTRDAFASLKDPQDDTHARLFQGNAFNTALPQVDIVLMNPPFTRQERLTTGDQEIIQKKLQDLQLSQYFESQMSLSALFILLADGCLHAGGRMGLVIPAATFSSRYTSEIIQFLQDRRYVIRNLVEVLGENSAFSADCRYKEYLIVLEKGINPAGNVPIITLPTPPTLESFESIAGAIKEVTFNPGDTGVTRGYLPQEKLFTFNNWEMAFRYIAHPDVTRILDTLPIIPFEQQLFATIRSGFHGTYVDFLFLPNDHWKIIEDKWPDSVKISSVESPHGKILEVPPHILKRAFRKPENTQSFYTTTSHFVLSISPEEHLPRGFQTQYIHCAEGKLRESMAGKLQRGGKETGRVPSTWYSHAFRNGAEKSIGHLWTFEKIYPINRANLSTFSREPVTATNMFHLISGDDPARLEALHSWFNTTFFFCEYLLHAKSIRRGWLKGTIGLFKTLRIPDLSSSFYTPDKIARAQCAVQALSNAYDAQPIPIARQIGTQPRKELDFTWAEILEIPATKQEKIIHEAGEFVRRFVAQR